MGQDPRRLSLRVYRWPQGDHAPHERPRRRLYVRRKTQRSGRPNIDTVLPSAQSQRRLFGCTHVESGGDLPHGQACSSIGAHSVDHWPCRGGDAVPCCGPESDRDSAPSDSLFRASRIDFLAELNARYKSLGTVMSHRFGLLFGLMAGLGLAAAPQERSQLRLTGEVLEEATGKPLPARVYIHGDDGAWHFPKSQAAAGSAVYYKKQRPDNPRCVEMHTTLTAHPFLAELPAGKYTITVERGHEYFPTTSVVTLADKPVHTTLKLRRWIDMAGRGWYSGETHVHRTLDELPNVMLAEDLNVAFPLVYWVTEAFVPPKSSARSTRQDPPAEWIRVDASHVIYPRNTEYEIFSVGKKQHTLGALFVIRHKRI